MPEPNEIPLFIQNMPAEHARLLLEVLINQVVSPQRVQSPTQPIEDDEYGDLALDDEWGESPIEEEDDYGEQLDDDDWGIAGSPTPVVITSETSLAERLNALKAKLTDSPEDQAFKQFLEANTITFLGGENCQNFMVAPIDSNSPNIPVVIKADLVIPNARAVCQNDRLSKVVAASGSELAYREVQKERLTVSGMPVSGRALVVTPYYQNSDLLSFYRKREEQSISSSDKLDGMLDVYEQMSEAFIQLQDQGVLFADSKNSNWLMDNEEKVRISDTKSFVLQSDIKSKTLLKSPGFSPPEFSLAFNLDIDKAHAYILGKNLYSAITMEDIGLSENSELDFSQPFFKTPNGDALQNLIEKLVEPDKTKRLSVSDANNYLKFLKKTVKNDKVTELPEEEQKELLKQCLELPSKERDSFLDKYLSKKPAVTTRTATIEISPLALMGLENLIKKVDLPDFKNALENIKSKATSTEDLLMKVKICFNIQESSLAKQSPKKLSSWTKQWNKFIDMIPLKNIKTFKVEEFTGQKKLSQAKRQFEDAMSTEQNTDNTSKRMRI